MDWCSKNNFDILDDDQDLADFTDEELDRYFLEGHLDVNVDREENEEEEEDDDDEEPDEEETIVSTENDPFNNSIEMKELSEESKEDELVLSQKLSQLSTKFEEDEDCNSLIFNNKRQLNTTATFDSNLKRMKINTIDDFQQSSDCGKDKDAIPTYLSLNSELFKDLLRNLLATVNSISIHDLQYIALCIHRLAALDIQKQVTNVYYKSGTGTLKDLGPELVAIDRRVWPAQVKADWSARHATNTTVTELNVEDQHRVYENHVRQRFEEMTRQTDQYEQDLDDKKKQLSEFTLMMEQMIRNYVHEYGIYPLKLQRNLKIALLQYDYDAEIMERRFLQENPTEYHIQTAKRLYEARNELEKAKRDLLELKQRIINNKPPILQASFIHTSIELLCSVNNDNQQPQRLLVHQKESFIRRKLFDLMVRHVIKLERKLHYSQQLFDDELSTMWSNHRQLVENKGMPTALNDLIERRLTNIVERWREIYRFRVRFHIKTPYGDWEAVDKIQTTNNNSDNYVVNEQQSIRNIGFQPRTIIDTKHSLTDQQLRLLSRGPTYVPPCQMHVLSSSSSPSTDKIVKKQYAPLKHQLTALFNKYTVNVALQFTIQNQIYDEFKKIFSVSLPPSIYQRAQDEQILVGTIRQALKNNNLILRRTADNMNTFYLGNRHDFERQADDYVKNTDQYRVFCQISQDNRQQTSHSELSKLIESINHALVILRRRGDIDDTLYERLRTDGTNTKFSYLYFLPDIFQENNIKLVPIITSPCNTIYKISKYLDQLLRPLAHKQLAAVRFKDDIDFIQKLNVYVHSQQRLTSTTMFCTIDIINYWALDMHENLIDVVCKFIQNSVHSNKLQKISIVTIKNLLQLCLYHNTFSYKDTVYSFSKGGPTTLPLIDTLANIYLSTWQDKIIYHILQNKELFGRYKDRLFFTWNGFKNELDYFLETVQLQYPQIHTHISIDTSVPFMNVYIANRDGQLFTRLHHDSTAQLYTLPYVVGHSKIEHSDYLRTALLRAVCCCSSVDDFQQERINLELSYLANGYSIRFVDSRVAHFFDYFHASNVRYSVDPNMYEKFRRQCFDFKDMNREVSDRLQTRDDIDQVIRLHYLYEYGARCEFNREFHELWYNHFANHATLSPIKSTTLLTTKHLQSLNTLLVQEK